MHFVRLVVLGTAALSTFGLPACQRPDPFPPPAATRAERWRQDLEYWSSNLRRLHKDLFHQLPQREFDAAVADLQADVDGLSDPEIGVRLLQINARVGDAHTRVLNPRGFYRSSEVLVWPFSDGYFIVGAPQIHREWLGAEVVGVGDHDMPTVIERIATIIPVENATQLHRSAAGFFDTPEILSALGLLDSPEACTLRVVFPDGRRADIETPTVAADAVRRVHLWEVESLPGTIAGRHLQSIYSYELLPDSTTLYCAYNKCRDDPDRPFPAFAAEILDRIDGGHVTRLILDLRRNGGGSQIVAWPLLKGLAQRPAINDADRLTVLIGPNTFSSAMNNAVEMRKWTDATLIGEPTGQKPNHFGEVRTFDLPNSKLTVVYSSNYFRQVDGDPDAVYPDITVPTTFDAWRTGRDAVLDTALSLGS